MQIQTPPVQHSQHSLSDFAACPRRYFLKYVARQAWPLIETGPGGMDALKYLAYLRRGAQLHQWIERYWNGIEQPQDSLTNRDAELALWYARFKETDFSSLPPVRLTELALVAPLGDAQVYARFDLLALPDIAGEGEVVIVDWKTLRGARPPSYRFLRDRLQTRVYLYVLATTGAPFNGGKSLRPEQCAMRYWLANFPEQPWVEIRYSDAEYADDQRRLEALSASIAARSDEAAFEKTADERQCTYCNYRTLCGRAGLASPDEAHAPDEEADGLTAAAPVIDLDY